MIKKPKEPSEIKIQFLQTGNGHSSAAGVIKSWQNCNYFIQWLTFNPVN